MPRSNCAKWSGSRSETELAVSMTELSKVCAFRRDLRARTVNPFRTCYQERDLFNAVLPLHASGCTGTLACSGQLRVPTKKPSPWAEEGFGTPVIRASPTRPKLR
jgi:hypothetical protein